MTDINAIRRLSRIDPVKAYYAAMHAITGVWHTSTYHDDLNTLIADANRRIKQAFKGRRNAGDNRTMIRDTNDLISLAFIIRTTCTDAWYHEHASTAAAAHEDLVWSAKREDTDAPAAMAGFMDDAAERAADYLEAAEYIHARRDAYTAEYDRIQAIMYGDDSIQARMRGTEDAIADAIAAGDDDEVVRLQADYDRLRTEMDELEPAHHMNRVMAQAMSGYHPTMVTEVLDIEDMEDGSRRVWYRNFNETTKRHAKVYSSVEGEYFRNAKHNTQYLYQFA